MFPGRVDAEGLVAVDGLRSTFVEGRAVVAGLVEAAGFLSVLTEGRVAVAGLRFELVDGRVAVVEGLRDDPDEDLAVVEGLRSAERETEERLCDDDLVTADDFLSDEVVRLTDLPDDF